MLRSIIALVLALLIVAPSAGQAGSPMAVSSSVAPAPLQQQLQPVAWLPTVMQDWGRYASTSRYMGSASFPTLYNLGCSQGQAIGDGLNIVVVLDFGYPWHETVSGQLTYGAKLLVPKTFVTIDTIAYASKGFIYGFVDCSPPTSHLTLAIGVNNTDIGPEGVTEVDANHGGAWADMVEAMIQWLHEGVDYSGKVAVRGAIDMEANFNHDAQACRAWAQGYVWHFSESVGNFYYNFGNCEGCPQAPIDTGLNPVTGVGWHFDDNWYVSHNLGAFPLPEIYKIDGSNAREWYALSRYSNDNYYYLRPVAGSMTQWQACQENLEVGNTICLDQQTMNTASAGWQQLQQTLNQDPVTSQDVQWSTDISWKN